MPPPPHRMPQVSPLGGTHAMFIMTLVASKLQMRHCAQSSRHQQSFSISATALNLLSPHAFSPK